LAAVQGHLGHADVRSTQIQAAQIAHYSLLSGDTETFSDLFGAGRTPEGRIRGEAAAVIQKQLQRLNCVILNCVIKETLQKQIGKQYGVTADLSRLLVGRVVTDR
jgi:hypothetical protein